MAAQMFRGQYEDEEVLYVFRKHPVVMRKGLIAFMVAIVVGMLPSFLPNATEAYFFLGLLGGVVLGIIVYLPSWIYWYYSVYIVTNQRFIQQTQKGFFSRKVVDLALNQIQMINYEVSGMQETMLGFGTINVQTIVGTLTIHDVHKPAKVQHELLTILRDRGFATNEQAIAPQSDQQETS